VPLVLLADVWLEDSTSADGLIWLLPALFVSPLVSPVVAAVTGLQLSTAMMFATLALVFRRAGE
jgi:hypothetical protein